MRVVSLLPSATELLCAAGGQSMLVGRSHECDFPVGLEDIPVLTAARTHDAPSSEIDQQVRTALSQDAAASLYTLDTDLLQSLQPDVILTQDLCPVCSIHLDTVRGAVEAMGAPPQIVSLNPTCVEDVFDDLLRIGEAIDTLNVARDALVRMREGYWSAIDYVNPYVNGPTIAFLEWMDPLFIGGHWTPAMIRAAGGTPVCADEDGGASVQVSPEALLEAMPEHIIICPCGFDLQRTQRELKALTAQRWWKLLPAVMDGNVWLVDGNQMFSRPGPRLVDAFRWLVSWINDRPEVMPDAFPSLRLSDLQRDPS